MIIDMSERTPSFDSEPREAEPTVLEGLSTRLNWANGILDEYMAVERRLNESESDSE